MYKYQLRKGGRKAVCPQCGRRRFVPYVLTEDNATIPNPAWGRCDRESSCGYWVKPNGNTIVPDAAVVKPVEPIRHWDIIDEGGSNSLKPYVVMLVGKDKADEAFRRYRVTTALGDWCVFWQIARDGSIRGGKAIRYVMGHRDKTQVPPVRWMHKERRYRNRVTGEALEQCFFGEHLLTDGCKVAVVESEKTALVMSAVNDEYVWLASGGSICRPKTSRLISTSTSPSWRTKRPIVLCGITCIVMWIAFITPLGLSAIPSRALSARLPRATSSVTAYIVM